MYSKRVYVTSRNHLKLNSHSFKKKKKKKKLALRKFGPKKRPQFELALVPIKLTRIRIVTQFYCLYPLKKKKILSPLLSSLNKYKVNSKYNTVN